MPKGYNFWTPARIEHLRELAAQNKSAKEVAHAFKGAISYETVRVKANRLGIVLRKESRACMDGWWTAERDAILRAAWAERNPVLSLGLIAERLGGELSTNLIAKRGRLLGLPPRRALETMKSDAVIDRIDEVRAATRERAAKPRIVYQRVTGCTFIDPRGDGSRCGKGETQTCAEHRARVMPIPKGTGGYPNVVYSAVGGRISTGRVA